MINDLSNYKPSPEIRLWQGVIIQAIQDATNKRNSSWINKHEINQAILWFERDGKDFKQVCSFAEMDSSFVRNNTLKIVYGNRRK